MAEKQPMITDWLIKYGLQAFFIFWMLLILIVFGVIIYAW